MSNDQLVEILTAPPPGEPENAVPPPRFRFSVRQPLAARDASGVISADAFQLVQCHDLSIRDIRYFVEEAPVGDMVVIGLGTPNPIKWLAAQVEDWRTVFMYGRVGYLVTARFMAGIEKRATEPGAESPPALHLQSAQVFPTPV